MNAVEPEPELILEDATSLREAMKRIFQYALGVAEALDARVEDEDSVW